VPAGAGFLDFFRTVPAWLFISVIVLIVLIVALKQLRANLSTTLPGWLSTFAERVPLVATVVILVGLLLLGPLVAAMRQYNLLQLIGILPYLVTIIVLAGLVGRSTPPAAVGVPYEK
jgi:ABC-type uncharacterized transport system permease subunit